MDAKDKAYDIVDKNYKIIWYEIEMEHEEVWETSKKLALLNTDEIIKAVNESKTEYYDNFWQEVKSEIEKL